MTDEVKYNKNWIYGYKAFNKNLTNQYGEKYKIHKLYTDPRINDGGGYHFCKNLEDVYFFYRDSDTTEIYHVCGRGKTYYYSNDYCGLYDVYATEKLIILDLATREEIINMFLNGKNITQDRLLRFISFFKMSKEELLLFKNKYSNNDNIYMNSNNIMNYLSYYQEGNKDAFSKKRSI